MLTHQMIADKLKYLRDNMYKRNGFTLLAREMEETFEQRRITSQRSPWGLAGGMWWNVQAVIQFLYRWDNSNFPF